MFFSLLLIELSCFYHMGTRDTHTGQRISIVLFLSLTFLAFCLTTHLSRTIGSPMFLSTAISGQPTKQQVGAQVKLTLSPRDSLEEYLGVSSRQGLNCCSAAGDANLKGYFCTTSALDIGDCVICRGLRGFPGHRECPNRLLTQVLRFGRMPSTG